MTYRSLVSWVRETRFGKKACRHSCRRRGRGGKRGNALLLARRYFAEVQAISGDVGARAPIGEYPEAVADIAMDDLASGGGVLEDIDTPEDFRGLTSNEEQARDE